MSSLIAFGGIAFTVRTGNFCPCNSILNSASGRAHTQQQHHHRVLITWRLIFQDNGREKPASRLSGRQQLLRLWRQKAMCQGNEMLPSVGTPLLLSTSLLPPDVMAWIMHSFYTTHTHYLYTGSLRQKTFSNTHDYTLIFVPSPFSSSCACVSVHIANAFSFSSLISNS